MRTHAKTSTLIMAALLVLSAIVPLQAYAASSAGYGSVIRINAAGKVHCDVLRASGGIYWAGKVRGEFNFGDGGGLTNKFVVRDCFSSRAQCVHFVNRIHHHVYPIEYVRYAGCKARG